MIDVINNKFFHLHNSNVSYIFYVMQNGQLGHLYYGKDLGKLSFDDLNYLIGSPTRSADVVDFDINFPNFSLAAVRCKSFLFTESEILEKEHLA